MQQSASLNLSGIFLLHVVEFALGPEIKLLPDNGWKSSALSQPVLWIRFRSDPKLLAGSGTGKSHFGSYFSQKNHPKKLEIVN
jgi:hypothetical protein